jgi:ABC-2 type transport system ATP-binding protein
MAYEIVDVTDPQPIIRFQHVTKDFGGTKGLNDVTFSIPAGAVVGLIGRNGSGKSTLLHHVTGLQLPTSGAVELFEVPSAALHSRELSRVGVVQQHATLPPHLTVEQLIRFVSSFHATWDGVLAQALLDALQLSGHAKVGTLSPGNRQRLALLLALSHHPALLLLDEPFSDLDPEARRTVLDLLLTRCAEDGCTMLLSSHLLHDIEPVITHVLALDRGRLTTFAEFDAVKEQHGRNLEQLFPLLTGGEGAGRPPLVAVEG